MMNFFKWKINYYLYIFFFVYGEVILYVDILWVRCIIFYMCIYVGGWLGRDVCKYF